jgi:uncharacterized membrane protein (DUF4010 family)
MTETSPFELARVMPFVVALGIGLLIGVERERSKHVRAAGTAGGIRTHAIVALLGAVAAQFAGLALVAVGALAVAALAVASYLRSPAPDPGITSEVALLVTYVLGVLAVQAPQLAAGLGVLVALLLAARGVLHEFVERRLSDREVLDAMLLAGAALVVLPLMPNRAVDPYGVVNPQVVWRLTVMVLLINAFGYIALRSLGARRGLPLAGLFGGFVSSAATIGTMGARVQVNPLLLHAATCAAVMSSLATAVQMSLVLAVANLAVLRSLLSGLAAMTLVAVLWSAVLLRQSRTVDVPDEAARGRAFQPSQALIFSATITFLMLVAAMLERAFGDTGALLGIALGGFADTHSAAASAATLASNGALPPPAATVGVVLAMSTNTVTKLVVAGTTGGAAYARKLAPPLLTMLLVLWLGAWAQHTLR